MYYERYDIIWQNGSNIHVKYNNYIWRPPAWFAENDIATLQILVGSSFMTGKFGGNLSHLILGGILLIADWTRKPRKRSSADYGK